MGRSPEFTREDCVDALKEAAERLGHSPSRTEYADLGLRPSTRTIRERFDGWNTAKDAAGLAPAPRGRSTTVPIDEDYFERINTPEKAYWLGTLFAHSSRSGPDKNNITVSHTVGNRHYVDGLVAATGSEYAVQRFSTKQKGQDRVQTLISNPTFESHLADLGLVDSARKVDSFPDLDAESVAPFFRGYLELRGHLSTSGSGGWRVKSNSREQLETIGVWATQEGIERYTISDTGDSYALRVSNAFDAATLYEACWPDHVATTPANQPLALELAGKVATNHHYPENLEYTDGEGTVVEPTDREATPPKPMDTEQSPAPDLVEQTVSIDPVLLAAVGEGSVFDSEANRSAAEAALGDLLIDTLHEFLDEGYPDTEATDQREPTAEINLPLALPRPTTQMLQSVVADSQSPFETPGGLLSDAARRAGLFDTDETRSVSLSPESMLILATSESDQEFSAQIQQVLGEVLAEELP